jgi:hypothetical protein
MDVIAAGERIAGDPAIVPILLGLAVMAATPCRPEGDVDVAISRYIEHTAELFC